MLRVLGLAVVVPMLVLSTCSQLPLPSPDLPAELVLARFPAEIPGTAIVCFEEATGDRCVRLVQLRELVAQVRRVEP